MITSDAVTAGSIVMCEPAGLLLQNENGEIDHKVLAVLPGEELEIGEALLEELQAFIGAVFAQFPDMEVQVGPIMPLEAALAYLKESRAD